MASATPFPVSFRPRKTISTSSFPAQPPVSRIGSITATTMAAFAPRVGFSYSPFDNNNTVIRGSYGIFYDFPAMSSWVTGTTTNGGANYAQNNPAGPDAAAIFVQSNVQWQVNVNPFVGASAPQVGAFGVNQNFKMPRATVISLNVEQQLSKTTLFTVGYVGTFGQHLQVLYDINQPIASGTSTPNARPYLQTSFPNQQSHLLRQAAARLSTS